VSEKPKKRSTFLVWLVLVVLLVAFFYAQQSRRSAGFVPFDRFLTDVVTGNVREIWVHGPDVAVSLWDGGTYHTAGVLDGEKHDLLDARGVIANYGPRPNALASPWLIYALPIVLLVLFLLYFLRKAGQGGNFGNIMSLTHSRAREITGEDVGVTFQDVGGCEEAKEVLGDVIHFLKDPEQWTDAGARLPRGILLEGPPGCGKTLLARAVAGEVQGKFFFVSASEFVEMFVGVGAARVRDMFEKAVKQAPAVVFIDELDAVGRRRGSGIGAGHDEREQTLNQLLVCLDGFKPNDRVVVIGATNRPDVLDPALCRAGRFDRRVKIPPLSKEMRLHVLQIHTRNKRLDLGVSLADVAGATEGFTGAQLENLCNAAALLAVRRARHSDDPIACIRADDLRRALQPAATEERRFNKVDSLLIESAAQLAEPTGTARVRVTLRDGPAVEGEVVWADASFLKLRRDDDDTDVLVPKVQVLHIEALAGTERADLEDLSIDRWALRQPDLA
jgi:cell division protease FtsH